MSAQIEKIVWTPYLNRGQDPVVHLSRDFAEECRALEIGGEKQQMMRDNAWTLYGLGKKDSKVPYGIYDFVGSSLMLERVYRPISSGVWLQLEIRGARDHRTMELYHGNNADLMGDALWLVLAFQWWHRQAEVLLSIEAG